MPALMCTTVPPAKSIAPHWKIRPASALTSSSLACAAVLAAPAPAAAGALAAGAVRGGGERLGGGIDRIGARPVPDHVGDRAIDDDQPQRQEQRHRGELHA